MGGGSVSGGVFAFARMGSIDCFVRVIRFCGCLSLSVAEDENSEMSPVQPGPMQLENSLVMCGKCQIQILCCVSVLCGFRIR